MDDLLNAYIYEIKKGTKLMALITTDSAKTKRYVEKIKKNMLSSAVVPLGKKDNIFFGISECVEIFRGFTRMTYLYLVHRKILFSVLCLVIIELNSVKDI